jgi:plasmid stability protein
MSGMPSLQVRVLPEHLYRRLREEAVSENRSITQETIVLLKEALDMETRKKTARRMLVQRILRTPPPVDPQKIPDPADLLREDRGR